MERSPKVATPLTADTVALPESVLPAGLLPSATVTLPVKLGTTLPSASCAATFTAGAIWWPAVVVTGWTVRLGCVTAHGEARVSLLVRPLREIGSAAGKQSALSSQLGSPTLA